MRQIKWIGVKKKSSKIVEGKTETPLRHKITVPKTSATARRAGAQAVFVAPGRWPGEEGRVKQEVGNQGKTWVRLGSGA